MLINKTGKIGIGIFIVGILMAGIGLVSSPSELSVWFKSIGLLMVTIGVIFALGSMNETGVRI